MTMRPTIPAALLLLPLLAGCASAGGGNSYQQVARAEADRHGQRFFPSHEGWTPETDARTGSLRDGDSETITLSVQAGVEYGIIGGCDQDCTDLDFALRDGGGNVLDSDYAPDDFPVIRFRPRRSGAHYLDVRMFDCEVGPCWYAYRVYRRDGGRVTPIPRDRTENAWIRVARDELARYAPRFFPSSQGWRLTGEATIGSLPDSRSEDRSLRLEGGGTYGIIATCDQDCSDVDLFVYDDAGRELDSDIAPDDYPILEFRAPYSGSYDLRVRMYDCAADPCYYAYEVYRR